MDPWPSGRQEQLLVYTGETAGWATIFLPSKMFGMFVLVEVENGYLHDKVPL